MFANSKSGQRLIVLVGALGLIVLATEPAAAKKRNGNGSSAQYKTYGQYHPRHERSTSKSERFFRGLSFRHGN